MRREVVRGSPHLIYPVRVVEDAGDRLTVFLASGTPISSPRGSWPWSDEGHPWAARGRWEGHGVLQMLSAVEPFSTWVFWEGEERSLDCWYINLQEPFRRTRDGIDSQDLELDFVVAPDGSWWKKDDDLLDVWVKNGRWSADQVAGIREVGARVETELRAGQRWWDERWASWEPRHTGSHGPKRILTRDTGLVLPGILLRFEVGSAVSGAARILDREIRERRDGEARRRPARARATRPRRCSDASR
jgi:Protein of unknown function (DUF402)